MIKIIAMLTMLIDHIGLVYFPNAEIFTVIGRLAFPLFAWGVAKGFERTGNVKMYALRLLAVAIISQYPYSLLFENFQLNVCFTLLAGLLIIQLYKSKISYILKVTTVLALLTVTHFFNFEYGIYGIATIVIFHLFKGKYYLILLQTAATTIGIVMYRFYPVQLVSILSVGIIALFEIYDFKLNKIIQYGFYPVHMALLLLL
ncbi:MAG: TraX family protein [Clostridiaceae bacterium]